MSNETLEIDVAIVGAGVVGLAIAEALTRQRPEWTVALFERFPKFGQEISSHNSEVIHAGIYYKGAPLKGRHCVRGKELLYEFCERHSVPFARCGKYIVATDSSHLPVLEGLHKSAEAAGVPLERQSGARAAALLDNPAVIEALWSKTTGIVDSHVLMERLEALAVNRGLNLMYGHSFQRLLSEEPDGIRLEFADRSGGILELKSRFFINSGGLASAQIACQFAPESGFEIRACRGRYFGLGSRWTNRYQQLIYPVPDPAGGLGVHLTFDLSGRCRLGPDVDWSQERNPRPDAPELYRFNEADQLLQEKFHLSGKKLLPDLRFEDVSPDYIGVRPKLFRNGVAHSDFWLGSLTPGRRDFHLLGIESPGLTGALSLAEEVERQTSLVLA